MIDNKNRTIEYLRISVTDRCNFRCTYCMPEEGVECLLHQEILTFEEITRVCKSMVKLGVKKIKLTGGEPLVRKGFIELVREIRSIPEIEEITLTTNGLLVSEQLDKLIEAGITSINISLDTLKRDTFKKITGVDGLEKVLSAIHQVSKSALGRVKVNVLAAEGVNEDELVALAGLAEDKRIIVRFIELMPIGEGKNFKRIDKERIIEQLTKAYGLAVPYREKLGNGPAQYYQFKKLPGKIGFISAVSECFCESCNRIRLTADGFLKLCLHSKDGIDIKQMMREGIEEDALTKCIEEATTHKPKHHHFDNLQLEQIENKKMSQIGG